MSAAFLMSPLPMTGTLTACFSWARVPQLGDPSWRGRCIFVLWYGRSGNEGGAVVLEDTADFEVVLFVFPAQATLSRYRMPLSIIVCIEYCLRSAHSRWSKPQVAKV
jgi:hypothetical protein